MTISALPTPPARTAPSTFSALMDALLAALPTFRTEANALAASMTSIAAGGAMTIPYTFSTTITDSDPGAGYLRLDNATQSSATTIRADLVGADGSTWTDVLATFDDSDSTIKGYILLQALADGTKWILFSVSALATPSGYRNISVAVVGSSTTDPFSDGDSLVLKFSRNGDKGVEGPGSISNIATATSDATLTSTPTWLRATPTAYGKAVTLPDATTVSEGAGKYLIEVTPGSFPMGLKNNDGKVLGQTHPNRKALIGLPDNSTAAGEWSIEDALYDPVWLRAVAGTDAYQGTPGFLKLTEDGSLLCYRNASGYPCCRYISHPADGTLTIGAAYVLRSANETAEVATSCVFDATRALINLPDNKNMVIVDFSAAPTLTIGTAVSTGMTTHGNIAPSVLDTRYAIFYGWNTGGATLQAVCCDLNTSGSTLSIGSVATVSTPSVSSSQSFLMKYTVNSSVCALYYRFYNGTYYVLDMCQITRSSGTTIAWGTPAGGPPAMRTGSAHQVFTPYDLGSGKFFIHYNTDAGANCVVGTFGSPCTWGSAVANSCTLTSTTITTTRCGASGFIISGTQSTTIKAAYVSVSGAVVTVNTAVTIPNAASACPTPWGSERDTKGIIQFTLGIGSTGYCGYSVTGSTLTIGSGAVDLGSGNYHWNLSAEGFIANNADGSATIQRFLVGYRQGSSNVDSNPVLSKITIDASGNVTLSAPMALPEAIASVACLASTIVLSDDRKAYYSSAQGKRFHMVAIGSTLRIGIGTPTDSTSYVSYAINSGKEYLTYIQQISIEGNSLQIQRWYPAEA